MEHRLDEALKDDVAGIGWSRARELNSVTEWAQFKAVLRIHYPEFYVGQERALGNAAGSLWRFLFDIRLGDVVLIPVDRGFFVGEVKSHAWFEEQAIERDFGWRRRVEWWKKEPFRRDRADNLLQRRLKARQTRVNATDLLPDIEQAWWRIAVSQHFTIR